MPQHGSGFGHTINSCKRISIDSPRVRATCRRLPICDELKPRVSTAIFVIGLFHVCDVEFADVDEMAGDGGGCGHYRADEVRAAVFALAAFGIAVGGAGAAL